MSKKGPTSEGLAPKKKYVFVVPGHPIGYKTTTSRGKWFNKGFKKYVDYKKKVFECAQKAGVPVPLSADEQNQLMVNTIAFFKNRVHADPGNVQKGACDALFYDEREKNKKTKSKKKTGKGNDKYTGGCFLPPKYSKENPRLIVVVEPYGDCPGCKGKDFKCPIHRK